MFEVRADIPPEPLYRFQQEYSDGPVTTSTPNSNFLKGVKWSPDGLCFLTASDDNWFRIYDTPPEVFTSLASNPQQPAAAADDLAPAGVAAALLTGEGTIVPATTDAPDTLPAALPAAQSPAIPSSTSPPSLMPCVALARGTSSAGDSFPPVLRIEEGELIYDYAWFPHMLASDPVSCCFAGTSRAHPVHLWDAGTGELRCTYRAYNAADEVTAAYSLAFDPEGGRLYCGYNCAVRTFDLSRPGRQYTTMVTYQKKQEGQPGIISCMAFNPDRSGMLATGAYSGVAALYDAPSRSLIALLEGHSGGITQVQFSADGNYLYTGARRDPSLYCWDVRFNSGALYTITRHTATTNQRIQFDIEPCGRHLATGGEDGVVRLFDLRDGCEVSSFQAADDTVNGVHFHPYLPLLATASGHRRFFLCVDSSDDEDESDACSSMSEDNPQPACPLLRTGGVIGGHSDAVSAGTLQEQPVEPRTSSDKVDSVSLQQHGKHEENVLRVWQLHTVTVQQHIEIDDQQPAALHDSLVDGVDEVYAMPV